MIATLSVLAFMAVLIIAYMTGYRSGHQQGRKQGHDEGAAETAHKWGQTIFAQRRARSEAGRRGWQTRRGRQGHE